ncbi:MAG: RloB family protein [Nannocystaceae bacterium]
MARLEHPTSGRGRRGRRFETRSLRKRFLIVCEGEVTEVRYFEAFPVPKDVRVTVKGEGKSTTSLVAAARHHADEGTYDEVWVVYDHDDFGAERFNAAAAEIDAENGRRSERWSAAWSNQAFEVWYLLHFEYFDGRLHRHLVQEKVGELLKRHGLRRGYRKNDPDLYSALHSRQPSALRNAESLARTHAIAPYGEAAPAAANPCTTVYRLVEALNAEIG